MKTWAKSLAALFAAFGLIYAATAAEIPNTAVFSQTDGSNNSGTVPTWAEGMAPSQVNDSARALQGAVTREWNWSHPTLSSTGSANAYVLTYGVAPAAYYNGQRFCWEANFATTAASTLNVNTLGAVAIKYLAAGTLTDTGANTINSGDRPCVTYRSTGPSFVLEGNPGTVNITGLTEDTAPDQTADFVPTYDTSAAANKKVKLQKLGVGKQKIWIPASAMTPWVTAGPASGSVTLSDVTYSTRDFDTTAAEYALFYIAMPKAWNEGTITFRAVWSHPATVTNFGVVWGLNAAAISDDDAGSITYATVTNVTDTGGTTNDIYRSPESAAHTVDGTPAADDLVVFRVQRSVAEAGDTMAVDARLHGVELFITTDANTEN